MTEVYGTDGEKIADITLSDRDNTRLRSGMLLRIQFTTDDFSDGHEVFTFDLFQRENGRVVTRSPQSCLKYANRKRRAA